MNLTNIQRNAIQSLNMLLRLVNVRVTHTTLKGKLRQHPDFPTLVSLSDTLDEIKVDNLAAHFTVDQLSKIPLPALAHLSSEGGLFAPVRATSGNVVEWWHNKRGWQEDSLADFAKKWDGIMLLIEPSQQSGESDYTKSRNKELINKLRIPFIVFSLLFVLNTWVSAYYILPANPILYYCLLTLTFTGILLSGLLVWYSLDSDNAILRGICQISSRTSCSAVLQTSAAQLFGWLSWAEIGLFYFSGNLLALLFFRANLTVLYPTLFILSVVALPYTFWSVYYQWRRIRQWCVLCLMVQGLLWLEFVVLFYFQRQLSWQQRFGYSEIRVIAAEFLFLPALWALLKPVCIKALRTDNLQQSLQKVKFDQGYIESLIQRASELPPIFEGMRVPTQGSTDAPHSLIVITNPTCSLCPQTHQVIKQLMIDLADVQCMYIIAVSQHPDDIGTKVASFILKHTGEDLYLALDNWYTASNVDNYLETPLVGQEITEVANQLNLHKRWIELAGVNATPTIFFNGIHIPSIYETAELKRLFMLLKNIT